MEKLPHNLLKIHPLFLGFVVSVILTSLFFQSFILHLSMPLNLTHGDSFLVLFILKHYFAVFQTGDWAGITTLPMFYGYTNSLFFTEHYFLHALFLYPFYLLFGALMPTYYFLAFITLAASCFSMYLLSYHFTKNVGASLVSGLIYAFSPYVMGRFPDHILLSSLQWLPLVILYIEKSFEEPSRKNVFLIFVFLTLQFTASSLHYAMFLTIILPIYFSVRYLQLRPRVRLIFNKGFLFGLSLFLLSISCSAYFYAETYREYPLEREVSTTVATYAAHVSDWFFMPPNNVLYGSFREKASVIWPDFVRLGIPSEHNLFLGFVPWGLYASGFFILKGRKYREYYYCSFIVILASIVLSFGPTVNITNSLHFPGFYPIISVIDPLLFAVRVTARFAVFPLFFLSLISSFVLADASKRMSTKHAPVLFLAIGLLVVIEYLPISFQFHTFSEDEKGVYRKLQQRKDIDVILEYPIGNLLPYQYKEARVEDLDAHYLLYASLLHDKTLFNGYSGYLPEGYYAQANMLSVAFPRVSHLRLLKAKGVDVVILHKDELNDPRDFGRIIRSMKKEGVPVFVETDSLVIFDLLNWRAG